MRVRCAHLDVLELRALVTERVEEAHRELEEAVVEEHEQRQQHHETRGTRHTHARTHTVSYGR